jgi:hypothetical protein
MFGALKSLWSGRKGFRWSLYFVGRDGVLRYCLHENAVVVLLGYVVAPIENGKHISDDWQLFINFNWQHKYIKLEERYFAHGKIDPTLLQQIQEIDSGWKVPLGKPVFIDARTDKELPLGECSDAAYLRESELRESARRMLDDLQRRAAGTKQPITLDAILDEIFVRK